MLFWLGSIKLETPKGRFILTSSPVVRLSRRRAATEEETAYVSLELESLLASASRDERVQFHELYQEMASEPFSGPGGELELSSVAYRINLALRTKQLYLQYEAPFGPMPEDEWEPPPVKAIRNRPPAQTPSEIWGRRRETFIGIRLKDQKGKYVVASRIQVKLPDGSTKEGKTNDLGELEITGFTLDGPATITLLDFAKPGKADPPTWPEDKEYKVSVVNEAGDPVPSVWMQFSHGNTSDLVLADENGIAKYTTTASDPVNVTFESAKALAQAMSSVWSEANGSKRDDWRKPEDGKTAVVVLKGGGLQQPAAADGSEGEEDAAEGDDKSAAKPKYQDFTGLELAAGKSLELSVQPHSTLLRLVGMNFDTDKTFLLPTALPAMRRIKDLYAEHAGETLLIVGHADSSGNSSYNETLSLERAQTVLAYLSDDVASWLGQYDNSVAEKKRWGKGEDKLMLRGLVARKLGLLTPEVLAYQQWHNTLPDKSKAPNWASVDEDGKMGEKTRAQLIGDYMNLDGTTLPTTMGVSCHGCGNAFPLPEPDQECAWERFSSQRNRRVEFLFFSGLTGVTPTPASDTSKAGSLEYPGWLEQSEIEDLTTEEALKEVTFLEMHDALFRTNSAVILPEGEDPGGKQALTSVGLFATVLRYNEEHEGKKLFIAGHTDTQGKDQSNQKLSEERAKVALALLTGGQKGRDDFAKLCLARHDGIDLTQIFHWVADSAELGFNCKPTLWDQPPSTTTVTHFKQEYNKHFDEKFKDIPGATKFKKEDGTQDAALWGAIFDCYEYGLRSELGEVENGSTEGKDELDELRNKVVWVDDGHQAMGFGERFPVDEMSKNDFKSQSNRRVEVLMFDEVEKPDLAAMAAAPDAAELYMPGEYAKRPVKAMATARFDVLKIRLHDDRAKPMSKVDYELAVPGEAPRTDVSVDGWVTVRLVRPNPPARVTLRWKRGASKSSYQYEQEIVVPKTTGDEHQEVAPKLHNLGYPSTTDAEYVAAVCDFQSDYQTGETGLLASGLLPPNTRATLDGIYSGPCDGSRSQ